MSRQMIVIIVVVVAIIALLAARSGGPRVTEINRTVERKKEDEE